jgi:hypothetical protein
MHFQCVFLCSEGKHCAVLWYTWNMRKGTKETNQATTAAAAMLKATAILATFAVAGIPTHAGLDLIMAVRTFCPAILDTLGA